MASVFELFGELKGDTRTFRREMLLADQLLEQVAGSIDEVEGKSKSLGQTTATAARGFERMRERAAQLKQKLDDTAAAYVKGSASARQMTNAIAANERGVGALSSRLRDAQARLTDFANRASKIPQQMQAAGQGMQNFGRSLVVGVTAPLTLLAGAAFKSAASIDTYRNKLVAATGSMESANQKLKELRTLAASNAGVFANSAADTYAYFKALKVGDGVINELIKAQGRLKLANDALDIPEFNRNLGQLFDQKFEMQDLKQAIGVFPQFGVIAQKAFGLTGSSLDEVQKGLQDLVVSGKLTREEFLRLFSTAVNGDEVFSKLADTVGIRFQKGLERMMIALEPLGTAIVGILEPAMNALTPIIQAASDAFASLSPSMQTVVIGLGAIAAAVGPLAIGIGAVVSAIGTLASAGPVVGIIAAAIAGLALQFSPLIALAAAWYAAWQTNFGGIRELVKTVADTVQQNWSEMTTAVAQLTSEMVSKVSKWWAENGEDIKRALTTISGAVRSIGGSIVEVWREYNGDIKAIVGPVWNAVKTVITATLDQLLNGIRLFAAVINGDWSKAWDATKSIIANVGRLWLATFEVAANLLIGAVRAMFNAIFGLYSWIFDQAGKLGEALARGMVNGVKNSAPDVAGAVRNMAIQAIVAAKTTLGIQSPSKVFFGIGKDVVQGFVDGIAALRASAQSAMASLLDVSGLKSLKKGDAAGVELLSGLIGELSKLNVVTKEQEVLLELTAGKYATLNKEVKDRILTAARQIDLQTKQNEGMERFNDLVKQFDELGQVKSKIEELNSALADPKVIAHLETLNPLLKKMLEYQMLFKAIQADRPEAPTLEPQGTDAGSNPNAETEDEKRAREYREQRAALNDPLPPPPVSPWENFWQMMKRSLEAWKNSLPSLKEALGVNLLDSIEGISQVFANAVARWDGTIGGFFKSVAQGFAQMAQQIIAELVRIAVMKAILKLIGSFAGGIGGGGLDGVDVGAGNVNLSPTFAKGGFTGHGGIKDIAGLVHRKEFVMPFEAVKHFGLGFMESIRNLQMPVQTPGFAGGGFTGGFTPSMMMAGSTTSNTFNNQRSNVFNINVSGGGAQSSSRTADQIRREVIRGLHETELRSK